MTKYRNAWWSVIRKHLTFENMENGSQIKHDDDG